MGDRAAYQVARAKSEADGFLLAQKSSVNNVSFLSVVAI